MKTPHLPIYLPQVADHQTPLMDPCFVAALKMREWKMREQIAGVEIQERKMQE